MNVITVKELAQRAQVTPQWIYQLIERGDIQAKRVGWMYVIDRVEAQRWLNQRGEC